VLSPSAQRVADELRARGLGAEVLELPESTRTAAEAAAAIGCDVAQIAKSLVFRGVTSGQPVLVIASGVNRVDEAREAAVLGEPIARADPDFVREHTGFAIGGVPPMGLANPMATYIDADLRRHDRIWAAAGTPRAVFELTSTELEAISGGRVLEVSV
jgi:prolyl-tRNA editing enzyme YbaK/EbsC (Cys-tRNA(Pro) deacylase)